MAFGNDLAAFLDKMPVDQFLLAAHFASYPWTDDNERDAFIGDWLVD